jgi:hypothetical protein
LVGLLFHPEDGSSIFLLNTDNILPYLTSIPEDEIVSDQIYVHEEIKIKFKEGSLTLRSESFVLSSVI